MYKKRRGQIIIFSSIGQKFPKFVQQDKLTGPKSLNNSLYAYAKIINLLEESTGEYFCDLRTFCDPRIWSHSWCKAHSLFMYSTMQVVVPSHSMLEKKILQPYFFQLVSFPWYLTLIFINYCYPQLLVLNNPLNLFKFLFDVSHFYSPSDLLVLLVTFLFVAIFLA